MPQENPSDLQIEDRAIYLALFARGHPGTYHWALFSQPDGPTSGALFDAAEIPGWGFRRRDVDTTNAKPSIADIGVIATRLTPSAKAAGRIPLPVNLVALVKVGAFAEEEVVGSNADEMEKLFREVSVGESENEPEGTIWRCVHWTADALRLLELKKVIQCLDAWAAINEAKELAAPNHDVVERGEGSFIVAVSSVSK